MNFDFLAWVGTMSLGDNPAVATSGSSGWIAE